MKSNSVMEYSAATRIEVQGMQPFPIKLQHASNNAHSFNTHYKSCSYAMASSKAFTLARLTKLITNWATHVQGVNEQQI